jgi:hypothetical protein
MSLTLSEIQALTDDVWMLGAANNWAMGNVMMYKLLNKAQTAPSGEYVRQVLEYARSRGGAMGATTIFNTAKKTIFNAARFPWAYFWSGCTYDIEDEVKVSGGDSGVDMIMSKLDNAQRSIKDYMGDSIWSAYATYKAGDYGGTETEPFYGIADLMNATGTYGSIAYTDLGTFTRDGSTDYIWAPYALSDARSMVFSTLQELARNCKVGEDNSKEVIDLIVTTATLKDAFENSLQAQQRHYDSDLAKAGFDTVNFRSNTPVVVDDKCTASYVHGFNTGKIHLRPHENFNFTPPKWKEPTNQYVKTCQIIWSGAFTTGERRAHGRMTNVSA